MMCVCVGYGCVCFLWVCGILAHNSCSSQVTAPFSRTYLAFLPRHDYHTPSTLGLAMRDISIIPGWNCSNVPEMNNSPPPPPNLSSLSHIHTSTPSHCTVLFKRPPPVLRPRPPPAQIPAALQWESLYSPFPPESAVCVCRHDWVIWQWHLSTDLLLG